MTQEMLNSLILDPFQDSNIFFSFATHTRGHSIDFVITWQNDCSYDVTSPVYLCLSDHHAVLYLIFAEKPGPVSKTVHCKKKLKDIDNHLLSNYFILCHLCNR